MLSEAEKKKIEEEEKYRAQMRSNTKSPEIAVTIQHPTQKYGAPALLSFFVPGLGQMIKGEVGRGLLILFGYFLSWILIITIIGIVVPIIIFIWQIYDAYNRSVPLKTT